jgi:PRTRC genetic system protein E
MTATFFQAVASVLTAGNNAIIEVQGLGEGQIKVIYTPNLGPTPDNASIEVVNLRAAIAKPMVIAGTADDIESSLVNHIKQKAAVVTRGLSLLDEIERLGAAALESTKTRTANASVAATPADDDLEEDDDEAGANGGVTPADENVQTAAAAPKAMAGF